MLLLPSNFCLLQSKVPKRYCLEIATREESLDYSNASPVNFPSNKYELYNPISRSRRLPQNPIDNIGIPPDVIIPYPSTIQLYDRLDQWDYFVKEYLENMNSIK